MTFIGVQIGVADGGPLYGDYNYIGSARGSTIIGNHNRIARAEGVRVEGNWNHITGTGCTVIGNDNEIFGEGNTATGERNRVHNVPSPGLPSAAERHEQEMIDRELAMRKREKEEEERMDEEEPYVRMSPHLRRALREQGIARLPAFPEPNLALLAEEYSLMQNWMITRQHEELMRTYEGQMRQQAETSSHQLATARRHRKFALARLEFDLERQATWRHEEENRRQEEAEEIRRHRQYQEEVRRHLETVQRDQEEVRRLLDADRRNQAARQQEAARCQLEADRRQEEANRRQLEAHRLPPSPPSPRSGPSDDVEADTHRLLADVRLRVADRRQQEANLPSGWPVRLQEWVRSSNNAVLERGALLIVPYPPTSSAEILGLVTKYPAELTEDEPTSDDIPDDRACVICYERVRNIVAKPCKHNYACKTCILRSRPTTCAICRKHVSEFFDFIVS